MTSGLAMPAITRSMGPGNADKTGGASSLARGARERPKKPAQTSDTRAVRGQTVGYRLFSDIQRMTSSLGRKEPSGPSIL